MMLLKITLFCVFGSNAMCLCIVKKKYIIFVPLCPVFLQRVAFTKLIVLRSEACSDWPAIQCVVIGRIPRACDANVTPFTIFGNTQRLHAFFLCVTIWAAFCKSSNTVTYIFEAF